MVTYPSDWKEIKIGDTGRVITGSTPSTSNKHYWGKEYTWITPTDIDDRVFMYSSERKLSKQGFEISRQLPPGSVLITCIASIGKNCILAGVGSCNQQINAIIPSEKYDSRYIYYLMNFSKDTLENLAGITATKILNKKTFEAIKFCVPELSEQQAIASVLSNFDEHIDDLSELIEKKKAIRDGALEDLLSGRTRLDGFSGEWESIPFSQYFTLLPTNTYSREQLSDSGEIGNIHYGDVLIKYGCVLSQNDYIPRLIDASKVNVKQYLNKNDVIIADTAEDETVGKAVQIGELNIPLISGLHTIACRPNYQTAGGFLGYYINSNCYHDQLLPYITGIKVSSISKKSIGETELYIPVDPKEQQAIAEVLTAMDEEIESLETEKEKMIQIKEGAMDDLLTGRVRLNV